MIFNDKEKYEEELKKHKDHKLVKCDEPEYFLVGFECKNCATIIQFGELK